MRSLRISDDVAAGLDELCLETGDLSHGAVLSRALAVFDYLLLKQMQGQDLILRSDGQEQSIDLMEIVVPHAETTVPKETRKATRR